MDALVAMIVTWLTVNAGLPASYDPPTIRFVTQTEMAALQQAGGASNGVAAELPRASSARSVVALHDDRHGIIFLPLTWTGRSPADLSVLVHEVVHHLQSVHRLRYACPQEREGVAYQAQEKWLAQFDTSLEREFGIDALTLLATTRCGM